nr:MAG TPA: hypothetical protein [Caudoviricetes sp.]
MFTYEVICSIIALSYVFIQSEISVSIPNLDCVPFIASSNLC